MSLFNWYIYSRISWLFVIEYAPQLILDTLDDESLQPFLFLQHMMHSLSEGTVIGCIEGHSGGQP